jgi:membrane-bound lytic murein transglycosylase D
LVLSLAPPAAAAEAPLVTFFLPARPMIEVPPAVDAEAAVPMYDAWVDLLRGRPAPGRAGEFLADIKRIFIEAGVPAELAWLPEVESTFNPRACNPSGARGLFQFMPGTAREHGLSLRPFDERTDPDKSARAAASLLRHLHRTFDSWPLALAAYNAGEGRVRRALQAGEATTFAEIADALPNETRLYVPRVLATLAVREGVSPEELPPPTPRFGPQAGR